MAATPQTNGLPPALAALLAQMQQQQPPGMTTPSLPGGAMPPAPGAPTQPVNYTPPPGPLQAGATGTPMAGFIGSGGNAMAMHPSMAAPVGQPPGMAGAAQPGGAMGGLTPQMLQLAQMLRANHQTGLPAGAPPPGWGQSSIRFDANGNPYIPPPVQTLNYAVGGAPAGGAMAPPGMGAAPPPMPLPGMANSG
jgi:hypothetical protein